MKHKYEQLYRQLEQQMMSKGYKPRTVKRIRPLWQDILAQPGNGLKSKLASARNKMDTMLRKGLISPRQYRARRLSIVRMDGIAKGVFVEKFQKDPDAALCARFRRVMTLVKGSDEWSDTLHRHVTYTARAFFRWLQNNEVHTLRRLNTGMIEEYLIRRSEKSFGVGMRDVRYSLKILLDFLHREQFTKIDFGKLLSMRTQLHKRLLPAYSNEELQQIVECARKSTSHVAKRNFAIIQLARTTGIRACDIERIKLTDIDWRNGEIHLIQKKTGVPIVLPLMREAGEAIKDYLLNERKGNGCEYMFLSFQHGIVPARPVRVSSMYYHAMKNMGFPKSRFDGKSFHAFRRTLGRDLVVAGVPPSTISQVLGHTSVDSVNPYINLDVSHLKDCALDFSHIKLSPRSIFYV